MGVKLRILRDLTWGMTKIGAKKAFNTIKGGEKKMPEEVSGSPSGTINKQDVKDSGKVLLWAGLSALVGAATQNIEVVKDLVTKVFPEPYNMLVSTVVVNVLMYLGKKWAWDNRKDEG